MACVCCVVRLRAVVAVRKALNGAADDMRLPAPNLTGRSHAIRPGISQLGFLEDAHALWEPDMGKMTIDVGWRHLRDPFSFLLEILFVVH